VDVEFPSDAMPEIYFALHVDVTLGDTTRTLTLEVEQHLGTTWCGRCPWSPPTPGPRHEVTNTGAPISVPVGDVTKGHVFNVLGGDARRADLVVERHRALPIHRDRRRLTSLSPGRRCSPPASRSSTCSPRTCGREDRAVRRAGVARRADPGVIRRVAKNFAGLLLRRVASAPARAMTCSLR